MNEVRQTKPEEGPQTQLSLPSSLLAQAQELGVDAARAAADGIRRAVINAQARQYVEENREVADAWNAYVTATGLPFEDITEQPI
ncbi:MAG TPA: type II toxin-antitoxin system CcdA family antitoxin [Acetobacteraceae bacterium]|nr:type II toxin-antitoxin system CcdA family antitoxin [Acetobacteraceae bacterium]